MSIASHFRATRDVALTSADATRGEGADSRRAALQRALDDADLALVEKGQLIALMNLASEAKKVKL